MLIGFMRVLSGCFIEVLAIALHIPFLIVNGALPN